MSDSAASRGARRVGAAALGSLEFVGGMAFLVTDTVRWTIRGLFDRQVRFGRDALFYQMVRVGIRSIGIVCIVQLFIGIILALQMAPTLSQYGQVDKVANIVGVAVFRELGPLISAIVLSGFAGASIAAELGSMVVAEEIEALTASALNPVRFLVMPRVWATTVMLVALAVLADVVGVLGGMITSVFVLKINPALYLLNTQMQVSVKGFSSGLIKAGVFGLLISLIACYEGLRVSGGAEGVGRATTNTVVKCIVGLIAVDCLFTVVFYLIGFYE